MTRACITGALLLAASQCYAADFSTADICKATIAVEMSRPTTSMRTDKPGDVPVISYTRADDGQKFVYRCKFDGDSVVWSTYFADENSWGRWRESYDAGDARTTYSQSGSQLVINNDQLGQKSFKASDF